MPETWHPEGFVRTMRACGHDVTGQLGNWPGLHRLDADDPTELPVDVTLDRLP